MLPETNSAVDFRMVRDWLENARNTLMRNGYRVPDVPEVRWDLRGMAAGQAVLQRNTIRLNAMLCHQEGDEFTRETVLHEWCHLVVWRHFGRQARPHGAEWKATMRCLQLDPQRCHAATVNPTRRQRRFVYRCGCRDHELSTTRHNRARRGVVYRCVVCRTPLRPPTK
ncbi:MAG: SprT-like domain-containing protein [Oceanococcaceae bacterium]